MLALLGPTQRNVLAQLLKVQVVRLASFQNRFNDVRRKECTPENLADIAFRQSHLSSQRSHVECLSLNHTFIPAVGAREGFYQRRFRMSDRVAGVWRHNQMNFTATPFPPRFDGETNQVVWIKQLSRA